MLFEACANRILLAKNNSVSSLFSRNQTIQAIPDSFVG